MKEIKLTKDQITQLVAGLFFAGIFGYFYVAYFWLPLSKKITENTKKVATIEKDITKARVKKAQYKNLEKKLAGLVVQKEAAQKKLPKEKKVPDLIRMLTYLSKKHNISISRINPSVAKKERYFTKVAYNITLTSSYHSLGRFLTALALEERILTMENVSITAAKSDDYTINVNFVLTSYQYSG
ncbi:MAG: type 4a pilus biogenesis protein PilO [Elusimicrobiales bacterium]|nr:type 4a pilus biogenesis protein PilO [Elusimicrobiales bacterium]MCK5584326.1 type 4a pilus biogenesis protein PilO [Elusimicrobiales bacterium]